MIRYKILTRPWNDRSTSDSSSFLVFYLVLLTTLLLWQVTNIFFLCWFPEDCFSLLCLLKADVYHGFAYSQSKFVYLQEFFIFKNWSQLFVVPLYRFGCGKMVKRIKLCFNLLQLLLLMLEYGLFIVVIFYSFLNKAWNFFLSFSLHSDMNSLRFSTHHSLGLKKITHLLWVPLLRRNFSHF